MAVEFGDREERCSVPKTSLGDYAGQGRRVELPAASEDGQLRGARAVCNRQLLVAPSFRLQLALLPSRPRVLSEW